MTLGLLKANAQWTQLKTYPGKKSSSILQPEVYNLLQEYNIDPRSLAQIVSIAGPGFYTGLRLTEGFCDVFKFFEVPHYSFYSYEIPCLLDVAEGCFLTKAYRGEYFLHSWAKGVQKNEMIATKDLAEKLATIKQIYIHSLESLDEFSKEMLPECVMTTDLLKSHGELVLSKVIDKKLFRESFYFRPPEDEFKANP